VHTGRVRRDMAGLGRDFGRLVISYTIEARGF